MLPASVGEESNLGVDARLNEDIDSRENQASYRMVKAYDSRVCLLQTTIQNRTERHHNGCD